MGVLWMEDTPIGCAFSCLGKIQDFISSIVYLYIRHEKLLICASMHRLPAFSHRIGLANETLLYVKRFVHPSSNRATYFRDIKSSHNHRNMIVHELIDIA